MQFDKLALDYAGQVQLLRERGLVIPDEWRTIRHLSHISYYRLSAYMIPYKQRLHGKILSTFRAGVTWDMVYRLYIFDRKLRLLIFDAVERLEVALRAQLIYQLSRKYGSHWQDMKDIFKVETITSRDGSVITIDIYTDIQQHIKSQLQSSHPELFIKHYHEKYDNPKNPPSWMCLEIMYFNHLSKICKQLKQRKDLVEIASYFTLPPKEFCSWLHTINYVRNLCAHHARCWNRELPVVPKLFQGKQQSSSNTQPKWLMNPEVVESNKIYYTLCILNYFLQTVNPTGSFRSRLKKLLEEYRDVISLETMGFTPDWIDEEMWR